ncbi:MAG: cation-translocating P-type ATPase [Puniceicoccales bacterium]|jgi:Cd2+/Zn2+-exporting ATPase|nr:cation-translocating P-type ATPase [Puniceicoccales bacterium]
MHDNDALSGQQSVPSSEGGCGCSCANSYSHGHDHSHEDWRHLGALAAGGAVFAAAGAVVSEGWVGGFPAWLAPALFAVSMFLGGFDALCDSLRNLPRGRLDIHFLMLMVAAGAAAIGAWGEGALLLLLLSASGALTAFVSQRTRNAIDSLFKHQPVTAALIGEDGLERPVPVDGLRAGEMIQIRPGDLFPVDGIVVSGESSADESAITGESLPAPKAPGSPVFAGTLNLWGAARVRVSRPAGESSLQKIIRLIQDAQKQKSASQRFTDRFGTGYTLLILGVTAVMFLVWWLFLGLPPFAEGADGRRPAFYRAMTLLVVSCPCALVLSIPSAILAAIAQGARRGILFRGGAAVEKLAEVDCVAFDKTGTLTTGELGVERIESFPAGREPEILRVAAALEACANHPIARAIRAHAGIQVPGAASLPAPSVSGFQNKAGIGVTGIVDGVPCALGKRALAEECLGAPLPPAAAATDATEVWVAAGGLAGRILLRDTPRECVAETIAALSGAGIHPVMLTGDSADAAGAVAARLGIREFHAGLAPEAKVARLRELRQRGFRPAMVGDGVNDAPALAAAHVSVGMGARGSDAALEQCDVVLTNDRIERFLSAMRLSLRARAVIRQNLAISLGTIAVMVFASIGVGVPLSLGVFAHEGSTVIVCLNSMRLLFAWPPRP